MKFKLRLDESDRIRFEKMIEIEKALDRIINEDVDQKKYQTWEEYEFEYYHSDSYRETLLAAYKYTSAEEVIRDSLVLTIALALSMILAFWLFI